MLRPSGAKDYRAVTLERLLLRHLKPMVRPHLDYLQFAYQPQLGVEDAIICLLNQVYTQLDKSASTVRVMFLDSSGTFYTVGLALLQQKLTMMQVDSGFMYTLTLFTVYVYTFIPMEQL